MDTHTHIDTNTHTYRYTEGVLAWDWEYLLNIVIFPDAPIRLVGGINKLQGRVEIMYQGIWGTICDDGWDDIDATVVCRELGFFNGTTTQRAQFESGTAYIWLTRVGCSGSENKLSHCMHSGAGHVGNCSHSQDVGIQCIAHGS